MAENEKKVVVIAEFKRKAFAMMILEVFENNQIPTTIEEKTFSGGFATNVGLGDGESDFYYEIIVDPENEQAAVDLLDKMKSFDGEMFVEDVNYMDILDTDNWKSVVDVDVQATAETLIVSLREHGIPATIREDYTESKKKPYSVVVHPEDRDEAKDLLNRFELGME